MSLEQRINDTAQALEQHLCRGLGAAPLAQAIRNIKLKALRDGLGSKLPDAEFNQAISFFERKATDKRDFQAKLGRAQARNVKGHRELLALLHIIGTDSSLAVLTKGPLALPPGAAAQARPPQPISSKPAAADAGGNPAAPLPPPPSTTIPASTLPSSARSTVTPQTKPTPGVPSAAPNLMPPALPLEAGAAQAHAQVQQRSSGSSSTPGGGLSRMGSGNGRAGLPHAQPPLSKQQPQQQVVAPAPAAAVPLASPYASSGASAISPVVRPPLASTHKPRPMFPIPDGEDMLPSIPLAGDLFKLDGPGASAQLDVALKASKQQEAQAAADTHAQDQGASAPASGAAAAAASSLASLLASIPAWHTLRPHLTGRDLVEAAAAAKPSATAAPEDVRRQSSFGVRGGSGLPLPQPLSALPTDVQEVAITNDLLYAFMGLEARYVQARLVPPPGGAGSAGGSGGGGERPASGPTLMYMLADGLGLEPCLAELVHRVLPICDYVAVLQRFIETRSALTCGRVSHAVAAALWRLLQDWMLMVTQLEHQLRLGTLRLQALVYYCQGPLSSLGLLAGIAAEAASQQLTSAGLLNLLHAKAASLAGDRAKRALVHRLLHAAAAPYFKMLERWLHDGVLDDAYGEFMVQGNKFVGKDALTDAHQLAYWHERYVLRQSPHAAAGAEGQLDVPVFLQGCAHLILTTGKYLNAIHECRSHMAAEARPLPSAASAGWGFGAQLHPAGGALRTRKSATMAKGGAEATAAAAALGNGGATASGTAAGAAGAAGGGGATSAAPPRLTYDPHSSFMQDVVAAHARASAALLHLLRSEQEVGLLTWLRSLKHFFLLDQGDLVVHLAEAAREELDKRVRDISKPRLQSLLELAIRTSSVAQDAHADELSVELDPRSVLELARDAGALTQLTSTTVGTTPTGTPQRPSVAAAGAPGHGKAATPSSLLRRPRAEDELGWSALLLSYRLSWPVTLIVPPRALAQYQIIFKHLFNLKHVERQLAAAWHRMQAARNASKASRAALKPAYCLAQRHLFLIQEILRYSTTDVLAPLWAAMEAGVRRAADADQVIHCHNTFLARALDGLMLCRLPLLRPLLALQQGALDFAARVNAVWDALEARQVKAAAEHVAEAATQAALVRQASRAGGAARVATPLQSITAAREQQYEGLLGPPEGQQQAGQGGTQPPQQYLDVTGLEADYSSRLNELVAGLQDMYSTAIQRDAGDGHAGSSQATLDSREQLESLQGLIERVTFNPQQPRHAGPNAQSTSALFAQLQSAAAQY